MAPPERMYVLYWVLQEINHAWLAMSYVLDRLASKGMLLVHSIDFSFLVPTFLNQAMVVVVIWRL